MLIARVFRPAGAEDSGDRNPALTRWATFCRAYGARHLSTICDSFTPSEADACAKAQVLELGQNFLSRLERFGIVEQLRLDRSITRWFKATHARFRSIRIAERGPDRRGVEPALVLLETFGYRAAFARVQSFYCLD